ncbi:hypothetical protein BS78_07G155400 [Paspalum vaginatum]|nr:hypothetical protein BS78_07G155400 [Paspalum vaginatum]
MLDPLLQQDHHQPADLFSSGTKGFKGDNCVLPLKARTGLGCRRAKLLLTRRGCGSRPTLISGMCSFATR